MIGETEKSAFGSGPGDIGRRKGCEKMGTIIVGLLLAGAVALIIRSMVRDKKKGKSLQCGADCSHCGGHCH